jgi:TatD DNase family protein
MLIDTHAHLNFKDYQEDFDQVIKRAVKEGVGKIICVSSNLADSEKAIKIAQRYPGIVFPAVGIHPQQTDQENKMSAEKQIKALSKLAENKEVVAIGECGLDYSPASPDASQDGLAPPAEKDRTKEEQVFLLKEQIKIAKKLNLPILIHSRKAFTDVIQIIKQFTNHRSLITDHQLTGVFHCYSAGKKGIKQVEEIGFLFGIDGNLTYDEGLQNVFTKIPLEKILLETDCPFLSPEPHRGLRNEPQNVKIMAQCLARIKGVSFEEISRVTTKNAENLFKI